MTDRDNKIFLTEILKAQDILSALRQIAFILAGTFVLSGGIYLSNGNPAWGNFARNSILGLALSLILSQFVRVNKSLFAAYITLVLFGVWLFYIAWDGAGVKGTV